uniref:Ninein n=1 Tax=Sphenodon punctatus TaxID=8508 RepID=A0A8D0GG75_SPHPU
QLRFWNPDDLNASQNVSLPTEDWIEEKLQEVCENLGISRDGHLNRKKLVSICEQYWLQNVDAEMLEDVFHNLEQDGTMSVEDFFYGLFKTGKSLTSSASTPYRQLKRHLSMQSFDESGRRTTTPSAMTSTIGFRVFSNLDDGMGYASVERILDTWHEEGIENSHEILKALDFSLDGKVNLTELTLALENELLITKNGIYQATLASFKTEIRHLLERVDQVVREKEKLRSDLEKAEKLKSLMASEVDDHHAAIERLNEYNLRKLDEEYKERIVALKNELQKEREQILQQAGKQRLKLEQEIEKMKAEENYIRDRLALSLKENSRLESELLETGEKLAENESLTSKLQKNLENVLAEKFGDLDPSSAEFFLQEERLVQMKNEYEQQCRELQDQIDELASELEEYRAQGRLFRPSLKSSLYEEFETAEGGALESDQGLSSEDCNPLNMSIEAEMAIEQVKEQHRRDLHRLQQELTDTVDHYEKQLDETKVHGEKEQESMRQQYNEERQTMEMQISVLKTQIVELQADAAILREEQQKINQEHNDERNQLQMDFDEEKVSLKELLEQEHEEGFKVRLEQVKGNFSKEREDLVQNGVWMEEKMRLLVQELERGFHEQLKSLTEQHVTEREKLQQELLERHEQELQESRYEAEQLGEENAILKNEITLLNEEGSMSNLKLRELNGSREELWQKIETVRKEKVAVQKMVDNLKKQVSDLKARNQQLEFENAELSQKNSKNQADVQDLNQRLGRMLRQREKEAGKCTLEEWEREKSRLKEELENCKVKSSTRVSSLETELSKTKFQTHVLEQENRHLTQELEKAKQLPRCPDLSDLQNEISSVITKNEKLLKENEALSEELNRCVEKVAEVSFLENLTASLKQEQKSWEHQNQTLKTQFAVSQEKVQNLDETLQNIHLQMSRLKSDLRVTQQEKETLKQEVISLHKQLQNANDKNQVLELAVHSSGLQNQQKKLYWGELDQLVKQEQQLLRQENERLQGEVQNTKADLTHSREKIRQLESTILSLKYQKHQSQSGFMKAIEQEKLNLKRECEQLQKELSSANRKISQMNSLERELETINLENEGLRKKQVKLDEQLMEMLHSSSNVMLSQSQHSRELQQLQQQGCPMVPKEPFLPFQHQLLQAERRSQYLQEELENRPSEINMPQGDQEQLLKMMEERMVDVEQKLRLVKRLLQEKVNQLKEQVSL